MTTTETRWGTVEVDEEGEGWLGETPVYKVGDFFLVTHEGSSYVARWVDEAGVEHTKEYATLSGAVNRVESSWGRRTEKRT